MPLTKEMLPIATQSWPKRLTPRPAPSRAMKEPSGAATGVELERWDVLEVETPKPSRTATLNQPGDPFVPIFQQ